MSRRKARKNAFILLFELDFLGWEQPEKAAELFFDQLETLDSPEQADEAEQAFVRSAVTGVAEHLEEIDQALNRVARGWSIDRMSKVDLAILRLALYEMRYAEDVPPGVAINEAVDLAKAYSSDEAPAFVNGVLGRLAAELHD